MLPLSALPLNALRAVEAVGRLRSLAAAADELRITAGAVSQHLRKAEERLGVGLFERSPTGLVLTPAGRALQTRLGSAFGEIVAAVAALQEDDGDILTVTSGPAFASAWLIPRLGRFSKAHPDIQLRLVTDIEIRDLARGDIDVAIRLGRGSWPGLAAEYLVAQSIFAVATPSWSSRIRAPIDLLDVPLIQQDGAALGWPEWFARNGMPMPPRLRGPVFSDPMLAFEAALAGHGIMLVWSLIAADALADGRLVRPFEQSIDAPSAYWLVATEGAIRKPKLRAFRQWLLDELAVSPATGS